MYLDCCRVELRLRFELADVTRDEFECFHGVSDDCGVEIRVAGGSSLVVVESNGVEGHWIRTKADAGSGVEFRWSCLKMLNWFGVELHP